MRVVMYLLKNPLAENAQQCQELVDLARAQGKALVVGYILRQHPSWIKFVEVAKTLGKPLVMRDEFKPAILWKKLGKPTRACSPPSPPLSTVGCIMWM